MAVNKDSNVYTIVFAIVLVVVVGGVLAIIANGLKPIQDENLMNEKKQYILNCLPGNKSVTRDEAGAKFPEIVIKRLILDHNGKPVEGTETTSSEIPKKLSDPTKETDAFNVDLKKQFKNKDLSEKEKKYPLFICSVSDITYYVAPVMGKGLWAAVWGYIALDSEGKMIEGAVFDHKSETPGLGAEITEDFFENQFIGKSIDENDRYSKIEVNKPGNELNSHQVDGISGGTFTSVGVENMMTKALEVYYNYIKDINNQKEISNSKELVNS
jgi:Na+-transporting NADH:ubiquinone oxidoreductase subunit C